MDSQLIRLIGQVYDAAASPAGWESCLVSICDLIDGTGAGLIYHDHGSHDGGLHAMARYDPDVIRQYGDYYHRVDPWALAGPAHGLSVGRVIPGQLLVPHEEMVKTEFHAAFGPAGHTRVLITVLETSPHKSAVLSVNRSDSHEAFDRHEVRLVEALVPHLLRALQLHRRVAAVAQRGEPIAHVVDRLSTGVVLVDASLRPILVNRVAGEILRQGDGLVIAGGEIRGTTTKVTGLLRSALSSAAAVTAGRSLAPGGAAFRAPRPSGRRAYQVVVVPLPRANDWSVAGVWAAAAAFIADPERAPRSSTGVLQRVYGFTPMETRIASALAGGQDPKTIAEALNLTRETMRWYVKVILSKAGASSQAEFVRLALATPGAWSDLP